MSEEKSLISVESLGGEMIVADQNLLKDTSSGGGFLPYLQLFTTKSDAVAEGKINGGEYGLVRDGNIVSLGKNVDVVVLTVRARAFQKEDGGEIAVVYDREDPEYIRIQTLQADNVQGCMAGPEFLIWVPSEGTFATFFCGSKTLKREARKFSPFIGGKACNLRSKLIDNGKYKWHGPVIGNCSTNPSSLPDPADVEEKVLRFKNPPKQKKGEKVEETATDNVER
jgi:hypothetical protein